MTFDDFVNSPQIKSALQSKDPYSELEKIFGNNPFARNVINLARKMPNNRQLETIANNIYKENNMEIPRHK